MQVQIVSGIYTDKTFRTAYPVNMIPVPRETGMSSGHLRVADGIVLDHETTLGACRGGINWNGAEYRVFGNSLCLVDDGGVSEVGEVPGSEVGEIVSFSYSFDHLAVCSGGALYLYDGADVARVTDIDLGPVKDVVWIDGYFATTDGEFIIVTELNDPFSVDVLKYGSSEVDPDQIQRVLKVRNELTAVNRYTIETFSNVGGTGFPFQRNNGAQIHKGAIGPRTACVWNDAIALVGGGMNEPPSVWICANGAAARIATAEIDATLKELSEDALSRVFVETSREDGHDVLYIHLPDACLCYDAAASQVMGVPVWYKLRGRSGPYRGKFRVWARNAWRVAYGGRCGHMSSGVATEFGEPVAWEFSTPVLFNETRGAIVHEIALSGVFSSGRIGTQYSLDGATWSEPRFAAVRNGPPKWIGGTHMRNFRIQKFFGYSDAISSVARCDMRVEPLAW